LAAESGAVGAGATSLPVNAKGPGEISKTIIMLANGDRLAELNETFFVNLNSPTNATIAAGQGVGTIVDDGPRNPIGDVSKSDGTKGIDSGRVSAAGGDGTQAAGSLDHL
jgi:hypothetical protein